MEKILIDANALKNAMYSIQPIPDSECIFIDVIIEEIDNAPTVDAVEVVHSSWGEGRFNTNGEYEEQCLICKMFSMAYGCDYCPNCGAKMDGDKNE